MHLACDDTGDEEAGKHEKDVYAYEPAREERNLGVIQEDEEHRDCPDSL